MNMIVNPYSQPDVKKKMRRNLFRLLAVCSVIWLILLILEATS